MPSVSKTNCQKQQIGREMVRLVYRRLNDIYVLSTGVTTVLQSKLRICLILGNWIRQYPGSLQGFDFVTLDGIQISNQQVRGERTGSEKSVTTVHSDFELAPRKFAVIGNVLCATPPG